MSKSIRLHPNFGLNPTIPICFWCGEERPEVAFLGAAYRGEAPMRTLLDYNPCSNCEQQMALGCALLECTQERPADKRPAIQKGLYPTGRLVVITKEAAARMFPQYKDLKKLFVEVGVFEHLGIAVGEEET